MASFVYVLILVLVRYDLCRPHPLTFLDGEDIRYYIFHYMALVPYWYILTLHIPCVIYFQPCFGCI